MPSDGHAGRVAVVALGLRADHDRLVDAAGPALEDLAVLVDEEVVADVVPAVRVPVVLRDPEHDRRGVGGRVVVRGDRVVDEGDPDVAVGRQRARWDLRSGPGRARDVGRRRHRPERLGGARGVAEAPTGPPRGQSPPGAGADADQVDAQRGADGSAGAQLELVAGAGPHGVRGAAAGAGVRRVVAVDGERHPRAPAAVAPAGPHLDVPAQPAQPEEVEAPRRAQDAARAPAAGEVGGRHAQAEAARRGGAARERGPRAGQDGGQAGGGPEGQRAAACHPLVAHVGKARAPIPGRKACRRPCHHVPGTRLGGRGCGPRARPGRARPRPAPRRSRRGRRARCGRTRACRR